MNTPKTPKPEASYPPPAKGTKCGSWVLKTLLGRGGNGQVWEAEGPSGNAAVKVLTKTKAIAYARFRDEVEVMDTCGVVGVVPIVDSCLPEDPATDMPWYVMPLGKPLYEHLRRASLREKVQSIAEIAETFAQLHAKGIVHRDVKPANLIFVAGKSCVGDFGLVDYPDKADLTAKGEGLGPRWTMAPEVRRSLPTAIPSASDVYSLAKTLWILISQKPKGFDGQYSAASSVSLSRIAPDSYVGSLDELLTTATEHDVEARPTMGLFAAALRKWLVVDETFHERNRLEWIDVQRRLFPITSPSRASWLGIDAIVEVLNLLGSRSNMNHLFFPTGGGLDLERATKSEREDGCIEIVTNGTVGILKPKRLMFEGFAADSQWDYFRLEADVLEPSDVYEHEETSADSRLREELTDIGLETYAPRYCWDEGEYKGEPLPENTRPLTRYFGGAFVIFQKTSIYNQTSSTYDARHNKMSADEFRSHIEEAVEVFHQHSLGT